MRFIGRLLLLIVFLAVITGIAFFARPVLVQRQGTHLGLFLSRVQSNYVLTPEGRVHYYEAEPAFAPQHGIPLVLVHGAGDRDESWAPMLRRLKRAGFHVYAPDLLGYGRSPRPDNGDYSLAGQEKYVYDFIQALGLPKTDIGGWSMGGWISLKLALDHPELLDRVVVFDTAGLSAGTPVPTELFHAKTPDDVNHLLHVMEPEAKPLPDFVAKDAVRQLEDVRPVLTRNLQGRGSENMLDDSIGKLTEPLLIVWGADDGLIPLAVGQKLHALVPTSELNIVEGCGHLAPKVCSSRVAAATADFLKANPAPQGQTRTLTNMR